MLAEQVGGRGNVVGTEEETRGKVVARGVRITDPGDELCDEALAEVVCALDFPRLANRVRRVKAVVDLGQPVLGRIFETNARVGDRGDRSAKIVSDRWDGNRGEDEIVVEAVRARVVIPVKVDRQVAVGEFSASAIHAESVLKVADHAVCRACYIVEGGGLGRSSAAGK